jgi:hypothetical protein
MEKQSASQGLTFKAFAGDRAALLAFDVDESLRPDLAGFAVEFTTPSGDTHSVDNRLTFSDPIVAETTPAERQAIFTPTSEAPLQKFHWAHYPRDVEKGAFTYRATAMLFKPGSEDQIEPGPEASLQIDLMPPSYPKFELGFTRGYMSSQAYAGRFKNAPFTPKDTTIDYDTAPYEAQYEWLGLDARRLMFEFLDEALADDQLSVDVFAYDLNEPDVLRRMAKLGPRLRLFLDNSDSHAKPGTPGGRPPLELAAKALIEQSAGQDNVKVGHFHRFSHSKVLIQRRGDAAVKVLAGSANFSVRGLYVQSNNVFVFDDPETAGHYEAAFEQAWTKPLSEFAHSDVASRWFERSADGLPPFAVSFSPHADAAVSLQRVADAIQNARSSVLFAIMEIGAAGGVVADDVRALPQRKELYAFGTTQRLDGSLKVTSPADPNSPFIPFAYLHSKVPPPFDAEVSGGAGQVIHHKFVVCDFNDENPVAFAGSSNLAGGGEVANGDNLVAFSDRQVATAFAVEAIQLTDHYRFRAAQSAATQDAPLRLKRRSEDWTHDFFDPASPRSRERELFVR